MSDLHCGHLVGLTPPSFQLKPVKEGDVSENHRRSKWVNIQKALWREYKKIVNRLGDVDILIVNGDAIEGTGHRSGGVELITTNRDTQVEMAKMAIERIHADKTFMTFGTPSHTGEAEDYEDKLHTGLGAEKIGAHEWINVRGVRFDVKHHISFSGIPHGQGTAIMRDAVWNRLWALRDEQPLADIVIRSHVHAFVRIETADYEALTTPALQGMGSKYGSRYCSRTVDWGMIEYNIKSKHDDYGFKKHLIKIAEQKAKEVVIR